MLILLREKKIIECEVSQLLLSVIDSFIMVKTCYPCAAFQIIMKDKVLSLFPG